MERDHIVEQFLRIIQKHKHNFERDVVEKNRLAFHHRLCKESTNVEAAFNKPDPRAAAYVVNDAIKNLTNALWKFKISLQ